MPNLKDKHRQVFVLLSDLCDLEKKVSVLRNELIEQGVLEDTTQTIERLHTELVDDIDNAIVEKLDGG